ncbi:MAG: hypothetical protein RLY86_116 [Pseudomonadota bacterium]|jgi:phage protein D
MIPSYRILVEDQDVTASLAGQLQSLKVTDRLGTDSDECELTVTDPAGAIVLPRRGVVMRPAIGWLGQALVQLGRYEVDEVEHSGPPDQVRVKGRPAGLKGKIAEPRDHSWHSQTLGQILSSIASRHGLEPAVDERLGAIAIPHIDQIRESDLNFITRLAKDLDASGTVKEGRLVFVPAGTGRSARGRPLPAARLARQSGVSHSFTVTDRTVSATGAVAQWHDLASAQTQEVAAGKSEGTVIRLRRLYPSQAEAAAAAQGALKQARRQQCEVTVSLATGRPELAAGQPLTLTGFRSEIDQVAWTIEEVTHTLTDQALTTSLKATGAEASE